MTVDRVEEIWDMFLSTRPAKRDMRPPLTALAPAYKPARSGGQGQGSSFGTPDNPRETTDPLIDQAAWEVAMAIIHEPQQDRRQVLSRYTIRVPVDMYGQRLQYQETSQRRAKNSRIAR